MFERESSLLSSLPCVMKDKIFQLFRKKYVSKRRKSTVFFFYMFCIPHPWPLGDDFETNWESFKKGGKKKRKKRKKISIFWEAFFKSGMGRLSKSMKQYTPLVLGKDLISNKKVDHISQQFLYLVIVMDVF